MALRAGVGQTTAGDNRRTPTAAVCALIVLSLVTLSTSCSQPNYEPAPLDLSDSDDSSNDRSGSSPTTTVPSPDDTEVPEQVPSNHSAVEAVRYYIKAETTAIRGGSRSRLRSLVTPSCEPCQNTLRTITGIYADGSRLRDGYTQRIIDIWGVAGTDPPTVVAIVEQTEQVRLSRSGEELETIPAQTTSREFKTVQEGNRWLISDILSVAD